MGFSLGAYIQYTETLIHFFKYLSWVRLKWSVLLFGISYNWWWVGACRVLCPPSNFLGLYITPLPHFSKCPTEAFICHFGKCEYTLTLLYRIIFHPICSLSSLCFLTALLSPSPSPPPQPFINLLLSFNTFQLLLHQTKNKNITRGKSDTFSSYFSQVIGTQCQIFPIVFEIT